MGMGFQTVRGEPLKSGSPQQPGVISSRWNGTSTTVRLNSREGTDDRRGSWGPTGVDEYHVGVYGLVPRRVPRCSMENVTVWWGLITSPGRLVKVYCPWPGGRWREVVPEGLRRNDRVSVVTGEGVVKHPRVCTPV